MPRPVDSPLTQILAGFSPATVAWPVACFFVVLAMLLGPVSGCGWRRNYQLDQELADRMLADLSIKDPSVGEPDASLETPPAPLLTLTGESGPEMAIPGEVNPSERLFTLDEAIAEAFRKQPRLRSRLESIEQAKQGENIAFAPFLPMVSTGYTAGAYAVDVGGIGIPVPGGGNFNFLPPGGTLPIGLNFNTGYELAEFRVQWLVTDFGKRLGRYRQAGIASEIAQLQTSRAFQTVAHEVTMAYYQVLRADALGRIADESVRRCQEEAALAEKLAEQQALERENVLRARVQVATAQKLQDSSQAAAQIARASLNLAVGTRVSDPVRVDPLVDLPTFNDSLAGSLERALGNRREFTVARQSIESAREGRGIARADFAPKVIADGFYLDYHQDKPGGYVDIPIGSIKLEWGLFEGGRRVAELRMADSKIRGAVAQAEALSDSIAFQVNEAYRLLVAARRAIERSRAPVEQTRETYRIVKARAGVGDATTTELIEAETAMTRAEYEYQTAQFDYLTSLAKLEYAMGTTTEPVAVASPANQRSPHGPRHIHYPQPEAAP